MRVIDSMIQAQRLCIVQHTSGVPSVVFIWSSVQGYVDAVMN